MGGRRGGHDGWPAETRCDDAVLLCEKEAIARFSGEGRPKGRREVSAVNVSGGL